MKAETVLPIVLALNKEERHKILKALQTDELPTKKELTDAQAKAYLIKFFKR